MYMGLTGLHGHAPGMRGSIANVAETLSHAPAGNAIGQGPALGSINGIDAEGGGVVGGLNPPTLPASIPLSASSLAVSSSGETAVMSSSALEGSLETFTASSTPVVDSRSGIGGSGVNSGQFCMTASMLNAAFSFMQRIGRAVAGDPHSNGQPPASHCPRRS